MRSAYPLRPARSRGLRAAAIAILCLTAVATAWAHNPDTSYTRIRVSDHELDLEFLFDLDTLGRLGALDADHDDRITQLELERRAPDIEAFLRGQIALSIDGQPVSLGEARPVMWTEDGIVVDAQAYRDTMASFAFHSTLQGTPRSVALSFDIFTALGERHTNLASIEHGTNHVDEIVVSQAERVVSYSPALEADRATHLLKFLRLGIEHIFLGYDHILFLLALLVISRLKELIKIVTAFTVAHTITLTLAALQIASLPPRLIETGIAATIMYVALENLWIKSTRHRWILTFFFGLVHGFGFANVLRDLGLPTVGLVRSLLCFNLGVEIGQLGIVAALLPLTVWLARQRWPFRPQSILSIVIFLFGLAWFIERAFALKFMPI